MQCVSAGRLLALLGRTVEAAAPPKELNAGEIENHDCDWGLERDWAGVTRAFLDRGYQVVANSLHISNSALVESEKLALVEGGRRARFDCDGDRRDGHSQVRLNRRGGQQRRHLFFEALHGLHGGGL